jgi:sulfate permease, SulP family
MTGVLCLLAGLLRLGFVANFLSKPVIVGFMHGLAVVVAVAQLPKVLGIKSAGETALEQLLNALPQLGATNPVTLAIGGATFAVILLCRRRACRARSWRWSSRAWPWCCSISRAMASP